MKKPLFAIVAASVIIGAVCCCSYSLRAQQGSAEAPLPHKIGLIDMAQLFKQYQRFQDLRDGLRSQIEAKEKELRASLEKMKSIQEDMKGLSQGSDEFVKFEKQLTTIKAQVELSRANAQRDFFRQESKVYKQVYDEVSKAVESYAKHYKYTLVLRFSREDVNSDDPQKVMQDLQRQVVFHQERDDITDKVLAYLNDKYTKTQASGGNRTASEEERPIRPVSNTKSSKPRSTTE